MQIPDRWHKVEHHGLIASAAREEEHPLMVFDANRIKAFHQEETGIMKHIIKLALLGASSFLSISGASGGRHLVATTWGSRAVPTEKETVIYG
jgi:hypothetical protein